MIPKCCYSFILATTMLAASFTQAATFDFESGSGAGTSTFTTTAGGITATFVAASDTWQNTSLSNATNIDGKSLHADHVDYSPGVSSVAVSFSSAIDISSLVISDILCSFTSSTDNYIQFAVTDGSGNSTVQETRELGGDSIGVVVNLNWTSVTSFSITQTNSPGGCGGVVFFPNIDTINFNISNNAPTDIALDSTSINQSATAPNAVVGGLTTTDADGGDTHTYSLVTNLSSANGNCGAAGDDNNASFQIDNTNDHLETASALSPGSYSVCIQTHDGTTSYQESFSITVADNVGPTISSVSVPANATYSTGSNLDFTVNLNENTTVNTTGGTPSLTLTIGATAKAASYLSGSGTTALVFRYTIESGLLDSDGIALGGAISLNGGTLRDSSSNDITTTLNSVGSLTSVLVDSTAPTVSSVSVPANATYVAGQNLDFTVNTSENVTVNTGGGTPSLSLTIGATGKSASYISGSGTSALVFRYTIESGLADSDGISLGGAVSLGGGTIQDSAGNDLTTTLNSVGSLTSVLVDATVPTVSSVSVPANATYVAGQNLDFTVNTSENVTVNTGGGTPSLSLTIGATGKSASYLSGSGTSALLFRYTIESGLADSDGIALGSTVSLGGGTIRDGAGNDLTTTLNSIGSLTSVLVDATAPTVSSVSVPANATYVAGQNLDFTVNTSENVTINTSGGTPTLALTIGATGKTASYLSGSGTSAIVFRYTVEAGLTDSDGISLGGSISLNSGTIQDAAGNDLATTLNAVGSLASVLVDSTAPTVSSVSVPANGTYITGTNLDFTVNTSENITVNTGGGTPSLALTIGATGKTASYLSGSGTSALVFRYTLESGLSDTDGIALASAISTGGGTLKDAAGNDLTTTLNSVASLTAVLVDAIAPAVSSVSVPANATYIAGQNLDFTINTTENVTVNTTGGTPTLDLTIGATSKSASYVSGSGTTALVFRYTIESGLADNDGIALGGAISLNSGTLQDAAGNNLSTTLNSVGSLTAVLVDATVPTVSSVSVPANATYVAGDNLDFTVNTSENVTVNTTGGTPTLAITIGATAKTATYVSGTGTSALLFRYTVEAGLQDSDGIALAGSINLNSGTIKDNAGNDLTTTLNSVGSLTSVLVDAIVPTVTISGSSVNNSAFTATITFSEAVTGFTIGDIVASNASLGSFSATSSSVYTVLVTPTSDGAVSLDVAANVATDTAGNNNTAASQFSATYDGTAPTVTITTTGDPVNAAFTATFTFSEAVSGFAIGDISAGNASLGSFSAISSSVYTVTVTPASDGAVTLDVAANVATDSAGNNNTSASQLSVTYDGTAPTVTITSTASLYNTAFTATITFSEDVTGFVIGDIVAGNASLSSFNATSASIYTVLVTPSADGAVTLDVAANVAVDNAGNNNTAATQLSVNYDATAPTVSLSATATDVNAAFTATVTFSEDVTGFAIGDMVAGNASLSGFSATSASVYTVLVTPTTDGAVTLDVAANVAADSAGNNNLAATQLSVTFDSTTPTVTITTASDPVNTAFTATITFSEDVTGFTVGDIVAGNASLSSFSATSASVYTVTVTPTSDGAVTLDVAANVAVDVAGNNNTAATQLSVTFDGTVPTVTISSSTSIYSTAFTATITFSEDVTGFVIGDIVAGNASLSSFNATSASIYTVLVTPSADGAVTLDVAANVAADSAGNNNLAATQLSVTYDATAPTVSLSATATEVNAAFTATITFSEDVTGFAIGDMVAGNASLSGFSTTSASVYTVLVTPTTDGPVTLDVAANVAIDSAGNNNTAATQLSVTYDSTAPTVAITTTNDPVNAAFTATITFSEDVTGFAVGDIVAGNANLGGFNTTSASVYTVTVTPSSDGTVTLDVAANVALDAAGNNNTAAPQLSVTNDGTAPTVTITGGASLVNTAFTATITFSEAVTGFAVSDIAAGNASLSNFNATSSSVYTVLVTPAGDGTVTLDIAADVAFDGANNGNTAATQLSVIYDTAAPTLASTTPAAGSVDIDRNTDITLTFSEAVSAGNSNNTIALYDAADDSLVASTTADNGAVVITGSDAVWTTGVTLTPSHSYYLHVGTGSFFDVANNFYAGISDSSVSFTVFNAAPVANDDSATTNEDNSVAVNVLANDTDSDSSLNAASTTVTVAPSNGSTSVNTATGVITYTPEANFNGTDSFTYTVSDVYGKVSNGGLVTLTVTSVNDAPVAVNDLADTSEDTAISINVAGNDTDIDTGDSVDVSTLTIITQASNGTAVVTAGEIVYTPNANFYGTDSFTYTIDDQNGGTSNTATVIVNVNDVNDLPVAAVDSAITDEDNAVAIDVLANDSDIDGSVDASTVMIMTNPANGSVSIDALTGKITYTPTANFNGSDSFSYVVQDDAGGTSNAATVSITVNSVNDAPVAGDDTAVLMEDTPHIINVVGNDSDVDGTLDNSSLAVTTAPISGTATINGDGTVTYTPSANFNGSDSFSYTVDDNDGATSNTATVTITVTAVNDDPLANDDTATTDEDVATTINLAANDSDVDGTIDGTSFTLITAPTLGSVASNDDGTVTYTPNANVSGSDSFTYTFDDDQGATSNTATVTVTVNAVNDAPTISGTPAASVNEDSSYSFTPTASDIDSGTLTFSQTGMPTWASFDTTTGALTGTPTNDDVGTSGSIVITVDDGSLSTDLAAFTITVVNTNDAPVISGTPAGQVDEDGSYSFTPTGSDVDSGDNLTYTAANLPSWASIDPNTGAITGTPTNDDVGIYRDIVVTVDDGTTTTSLPAFSLTVANTNDAPVATADSYTLAEGGILQTTAQTGVLANDVDVDAGDTLTATLVTGPTRAGNFTLNEDGSFSYRHNGGESRSDSFTYALSDGTVTLPATTVNLAITVVNDAPRFTSTPAQTGVTQGNRFSYTPITQDPDSVVDVEYTSGPSWLTFDGITLSGQVPFDAAIGDVAVTLTASDQSFDITQTFNLTVIERDTTLVTIATGWQGLPALVDEPLTLTATLTHSAGPAVANGELLVTIQGQDVNITAAGCEALSVSATSSQYTCPYALATGASISQTVTLSRASEGNIIVNFSAIDTLIQTEVGAAITDVSVTDIAVGQGNTIFNLADATSLASIDLDGEGSRELVAGTSLGGEVQLLSYDLGNRTAEVMGTIANTGHTRQVKVGDINGDGLDDVVVVNDNGDASNVYYQSGANSFEPEPSTEALPYASRALLVDLDNDDLPELILGGRGNWLYIYPNVDGIYSATPLIFSSPVEIVHFALFNRAPGSEPYTGKFAISTQGAVKLVRFSVSAAGNQKPQLGTQRKAGSEANSEQVLVFEELDSMDIAGVTELISQDLDNDGEQELIVSTTHTNNSAAQSGVSITKISGDSLQPVATLGNASAKDVKLADFNGDGVTDLLVANDNDSYQFYLGDGTATGWALKDTIIFSPSTLVLPEDVNGDGLADVIVYEDDADEVDLYLSDFDGNLGQTANLSLTASASAISNTRYQWQYVLTLTNPATESINDVTLTATLPAGITVAAKPAVCTVAGTGISCSLASLAAGSETFAFTLTANAKPAGSANATVNSNALDNDLSNNSAATDFAPLFSNTQVRVEGGGKSGGTVHPWMVFILAALLAIRFGEPLFKLLLKRIKQTQLTHFAQNGKHMNYARFKPITLAIAFLAMLLSSFNAKADERWFIEANLGKASSHWNAAGLKATLQANAQEVTITDLDDERGTQELTLGYRIKPMLAVELGYRDWGEISYSLEGVASNTDALLSATQSHYPASGKGAFAGLRASYWHDDNLEGYAKLSAWDWSGEYTTFINNEAHVAETGDTDVVVSVGMNGYFFERYSAGVVWQSARLEGQRNVVVGFSFGVRF